MTKPLIIIDARLFGPKNTGIGRYTQNLLISLKNQKNFSNFRFGLIIKNEDKKEISSLLGNSYQYFETNISHYSLKEQLLLPSFINQLKPDLVHFTHFNKPLLYFGKSVVTIHDLIKHFYRGKETTTKKSFFYWPKYLIYRFLTDFTIKHNSLIVPSNYWRNYIIHHYHLAGSKITTTYEAVDPNFQIKTNLTAIKPENYILYTGNLYPHKNIIIILKALKHLPSLKLKIISARDVFYDRIKKIVAKMNLENQVEFLGYVPDQHFFKLYHLALALIHPSFMEGFSLTGLEAMSLSCPVISSNSSCLPEIYGDSVLYFNPKDEQNLVSQIQTLQNNPTLRQKLINLGHKQVKKYSWQKTAQLTFSVYEKTLQ
jgi:glycosyltransferase involved in cell wall biosynthesis